MYKQDNKILKYNHAERSRKIPFIIHTGLESLLEKMSTCHNSQEKWPKMNKHTPSGCSLFTYCSFDLTKNNFDYYRSKECTKGL